MTDRLPVQHLFGLDFVSAPSVDVVVGWMRAALAERDDDDGGGEGGHGAWRFVVTPNVDHVVRYRRHPEEAAVARAAVVVLPDGSPIVWASRFLDRPLDARLTGVELFSALFPALAHEGVPTLLVAPDDGVAASLRAEHPALTTIVPPVVELDDAAGFGALAEEVATAVTASGAGVVVVALSGPKAHRLGRALMDRPVDHRGPGPFVLLVGAAPEFHLGHLRRAPVWMQRAGLEWLHRLVQDPLRLARRYLVDDMAFVGLVWGEWRRRRRSPARRPGPLAGDG